MFSFKNVLKKINIVKRGKELNGPLLLCGDYAELHSRITGKDDFKKTIKSIKENKYNHIKIIIGLTRYNFFRVNEILKFCLALLEKEYIASDNEKILIAQFNIFPIRDIVSNFFLYLERIKGILKNCANIEIELIDEDLRTILEIAGFNAYLHPECENDLARTLGVVCEGVFIGPQTIVVDPYHRCNIKCIHCFVHNPIITHKEEFLKREISIDRFKEIIDDAAELKVENIILQGDGEPLLHPNFLDMIRYVSQKGVKPLFFTNGCFLNQKIAKEVIDLGVIQIFCSLPAGTEQGYEKVCINPKKGEWFHIIVENLRALMELKRNFRKIHPVLTMTHVLHSLNFDELIKMAELDVYIGADSARFYLIRLDKNNRHLKLSDEQIATIEKDLSVATDIFKKAGIEFIDNIRFQLSHYDNNTGAWSKDIFLKEGCVIGWYFCLIPALGDISMCCHLRTVGYLNEKGLKDIWLSDYYKRKRYQLKFISSYKDVECMNGVKLYDEHCEHCDNHQNLLNALTKLKDFGLYRFLNNDI